MRELYKGIQYVYYTCRSLFLLRLIMVLVNGFLNGAVIYVIQHLLNSFQFSTHKEVFFALISFLIINAISMIINIISALVEQKQSLLLGNRLDIDVLEKYKELSLSDYEREKSHTLIMDANELGKGGVIEVYENVVQLIESAISVFSIGFVVAQMDRLVVGGIMAVAAISAYLQILCGRRIYLLRESMIPGLRRVAYINSLLEDNYVIKEIIGYQAFDYMIRKFVSEKNALLRKSKEMLGIRTRTNAVTSGMDYALTIAVMVVIYFKSSSTILFGHIIAYFESISRINACMKTIFTNAADIYNAKPYVLQFFQLMDLQKPHNECEEKKKISCVKEISMKSISFQYPDRKSRTLSDISLTLHSGKLFVLTGDNGSGKTTLIKLIAGLYKPTDGCITVNGIDLNCIDMDSYNARISVMFQDYNKYEDSLQVNIEIGDPNKKTDKEKIRQVLRKTEMEWLEGDEGILNTQLGNLFSGVELSQGQWQRIALSRALYRESDVIILDEPTASLDGTIKMRIIDYISCLAKEKIVVVVSHDASIINDTNTVCIHLQNGTITHKEKLCE